jgi:hypothetical protein
LAGVLKEALDEPEPLHAVQRLHHHQDDDYWDHANVIAHGGVYLSANVIPRFKTSGLSGDEWRIHAQLEMQVDNKLVFEQGFRSMNTLFANSAHFVYKHAKQLLENPKAVLQVRRKGHLLFEQSFDTFGEAALGMGWHNILANEGTKDIKWHHLTNDQERERCQQVGCSATPTNVYRLKKLSRSRSHGTLEAPRAWEGQYTWYCARHTERGDCGLEDCDSNLVLVSGNGIPVVVAADESPSACVVLK